ncbi:MAG: hypothetical protein JNM56_30695 [Planctomycetia bacterium]|nr:hypothetical protein [Planctomycetia bacterium]
MSIASQCPGCARKFNAPDHLAGKNVRCPQCNTSFLVQAGGAPVNFDFGSASASEASPAPTPAAEPGRRSLLIGAIAAGVGMMALMFLCTGVGVAYYFLFAGPGAGWKEYTSADGGFTVLLPPNPAQKDKSDPKITAGKITEISAQPFGSRHYSVQYYDLADLPINNYLYLAWLRHSLVSAGGTLVREQDVTAGPYSGKEVVVELAGDQLLVRRTILAEARVFSLTAQYPKSSAPSAEAQKFFDSFKVTSVPKVTRPPTTLVATGPTTPDPLPKTDPTPKANPKTDPPPKTDPVPKMDPPVKTPPATFPIKPDELALLEAINRLRQADGARPLLPVQKLFVGARAEADSLARTKNAGKQDNYGYLRYFRLTIPSRGMPPAQELVDQLVLSKSTRAQLVEEEFDHIGIGIATAKDGTTYYMLLFCGGTDKAP